MATDSTGAQTQKPQLKKTLGLGGVTINAMALIAPGAFLWLTFQINAAQTSPSGASTANDIFFGLTLALILAFLTAASYAWLARRYPDAGPGSSYYFAQRALLDNGSSNTSASKRQVRCRLDFSPLLLGLSRGHGCSNVYPAHMDFICTWFQHFTLRRNRYCLLICSHYRRDSLPWNSRINENKPSSQRSSNRNAGHHHWNGIGIPFY